MSGILMTRADNCILLLSDGGLFRSTKDFTITGFVSKPIRLPHLSAVIGFAGTASLAYLMEHNQQPRWRSFDQMLEVFRDGLETEVVNVYRLEPLRDELAAMFLIGGYSESRGRWENYEIRVMCDASYEDPVITDLEGGYMVQYFPQPSPEAMLEAGLKDAEGNITGSIFREDDQVALMSAMRKTPQFMGGVGDDADTAPTGHTIGGFIERIIVMRDQIISEIIWRWPDEPGQMIDPSQTGAPTPRLNAGMMSVDV